ncbi:MAG: hypothetical protein HYR60_09115 [Acidobacteria bacterium]|nr:hypothetical protein [Acidobacteriota bacterium]MBI3473595.1 hypothetical protein [Candidatus Solibacter usitatus]
MLSTRLLHRIEDHADELATRITRRLREEPNLVAYHSLSDSNLYDRIFDVCKHLGEWLADKPEEKIRVHYEELGRQRRQEAIPLHEVVLALLLTKEEILNFARSAELSETVLELYGKEELELQVSRFFDRSIYYLVRGYEEALRLALRAAAPLRGRPMYQAARF